MKKLRLLITKACPKQCDGCCNKDWKLDELPVCTDYSGYDEILITGGEPLLRLTRITSIIMDIRRSNKDVKIYIYTAFPSSSIGKFLLNGFVNGITFTLHEQKDVNKFKELDIFIALLNKQLKPSLRLNIFKGVVINTDSLVADWVIKSNIEWIKDCPLPTDEVFMRTKNID